MAAPPEARGVAPATPKKVPKDANEVMEMYGDYIDELYSRWPETFKKLHDFLKRGNCRCSSSQACQCTSVGMMCDCSDPSTCTCGGVNPQTLENDVGCCTHQLKHKVRVYDINPEATTLESYVTVRGEKHRQQIYYDAADEKELEKLKTDLFESSKTEATGSGGAKNTHLRLITVSHLSANVAKMLGGIYDIHADFFNRHLPGTEAISGRLLSRVPSAIQIEFDELYEARDPFEKIWRVAEKPGGLQGHKFIRHALQQNFLICQAGWDYFPISEGDWKNGRRNTPMSAGFEDVNAENTFQFNLAHRISVYSIPKGHGGHPMTAIILFYPRLELCNNPSHLIHSASAEGEAGMGLREHDAKRNRNECSLLEFRAIPDTIPPMSDYTPTKKMQQQGMPPRSDIFGNNTFQLKDKWDYAGGFHKEFLLHVENHFKSCQEKKIKVNIDFIHCFGFPLFRIVSANWARLIHKRGLDLDMLEWRPHEDKDTKGSIHTVEETKSRRGALVRHHKAITATLEMLRHLKQQEKAAHFEDEVTKVGDSNLKELEKVKLKYRDDDNGYNKGLSDGLSGEDADGDTWEALYYDFFELKAGVDALEKRADKIAESMLAMMNVKIQSSNREILVSSKDILASSKKIMGSNGDILKSNGEILELHKKLMEVNTEIQRSAQISGERGGALNWIVAVISVFLGAFTIVDAVYPLNPNSDEFIPTGNGKFWRLWGIVLSVAMVVAVVWYVVAKIRAEAKEKEQKKKWIEKGILPDEEGKYHV
ncbi:hypothetical protein B0H67DRAFT_260872 [Lasiosphaeris hirsuta]|uniref:Uncharacterized protein n=1 Tax=Lasiosphaeris hirsuta TaxID=260670 RepID=A0AA40AI67_9PEZI|nr:hypothetical protein B0H67DRAFT_260872 [Lasiosphaeris hirsuta]